MFPGNPYVLNAGPSFSAHFLKLMKARKLESFSGMLADGEKFNVYRLTCLFPLIPTQIYSSRHRGSAGASLFMQGTQKECLRAGSISK